MNPSSSAFCEYSFSRYNQPSRDWASSLSGGVEANFALSALKRVDMLVAGALETVDFPRVVFSGSGCQPSSSSSLGADSPSLDSDESLERRSAATTAGEFIFTGFVGHVWLRFIISGETWICGEPIWGDILCSSKEEGLDMLDSEGLLRLFSLFALACSNCLGVMYLN